MSWYLRKYLFYWALVLELEVTRLPGAYEEEVEALRFLNGFGTYCVSDGAEHHRTRARQGHCLLPAPHQGWSAGPSLLGGLRKGRAGSRGARVGVEWLGWVSAWPEAAMGHRDVLHLGCSLSLSHGRTLHP